jgi:hypothetical protein
MATAALVPVVVAMVLGKGLLFFFAERGPSFARLFFEFGAKGL